ncbi:uncharacterized protein NEMAJ01_1816 [Nematocida major]|uniref:uncharacterized protein n=1 Tax=Nematocida major TaxID=1912982 RepID=UPI00200731B4|nr:uncharacterized protein NEMAJ01_1816 [Nematocida major]KAH9386920.1 hypothetical protein NEMAJ01_1816 [Nematocida major]
MLSTITQVENSLLILNGETLHKFTDGKRTDIPLHSKALFIEKSYILTEKKEVLHVENETVRLLGTLQKTPSILAEESGCLYVTDRTGAVYRMHSKPHTPESPNIPEHIFGSISLITEMKISGNFIITSDKDSKIRITNKEYPHRIEEYVLLHSRPILSATLLHGCIVAGGYDPYLSIYSLDTKKTKILDLKTLTLKSVKNLNFPGVQDPANIPNINTETSPAVKKILAAGDFLLLISPGKTLLVKIPHSGEGTLPAFPVLPQEEVVDAAAENSKFTLLTAAGRVFELAPNNSIDPSPLAELQNYAHTTDTSIVAKALN